MNTKIGMSIHNEFKFQVVDAKTGKVKQEAISHNMVLNGFFTNICQAWVSGRYIQRFWIGQGTGTLDPTRTKLFTHLFTKDVTAGASAILDEGLNRKIYTATLTELESVGLISEIGLGDNSSTSSYRIFTHSLITDSEGNPITINKTDADILYITATVWSEITSPPESTLKFIRAFAFSEGSLYSTDVTDANAKPGAVAAASNSCPLINSSLTAQSLAYSSNYGYAYISALTKPLQTQGAGISSATTSVTDLRALAAVGMTATSISDTVVRCTTSQVLSTSGNPGEGSVLIRSIMLGQIGFVTFPNHDVYPPKALTLTATASGSDTEFNFPIAELMVAGAQVYVNDVLQDPSTYTFNGKNFEYAQAWASQDNEYIKSYCPVGSLSSASTRYQPVYPARVSVPGGRYIAYYPSGTPVDPWVWDFQTPKAVNCFANGYLQLSTGAGNLVLESSDDEITWTARATLSNAVSIVNFETVTARYWRVKGNLGVVSETIMYNTKGFLGAFDEKKPQLVLDNPPAAGAVVKVVANCEYPMKNVNWRIDPIVADITITRGTEGTGGTWGSAEVFTWGEAEQSTWGEVETV